MKSVCHNAIRFDYNCREAIQDLQEAIRKAEAQRNKEPARRGRGSAFYITRKW